MRRRLHGVHEPSREVLAFCPRSCRVVSKRCTRSRLEEGPAFPFNCVRWSMSRLTPRNPHLPGAFVRCAFPALTPVYMDAMRQLSHSCERGACRAGLRQTVNAGTLPYRGKMNWATLRQRGDHFVETACRRLVE